MRSISSRGPIDTLSIFCLSERILDFQNIPVREAFLKPSKCFIVRVGRLDGLDGLTVIERDNFCHIKIP